MPSHSTPKNAHATSFKNMTLFRVARRFSAWFNLPLWRWKLEIPICSNFSSTMEYHRTNTTLNTKRPYLMLWIWKTKKWSKKNLMKFECLFAQNHQNRNTFNHFSQISWFCINVFVSNQISWFCIRSKSVLPLGPAQRDQPRLASHRCKR